MKPTWQTDDGAIQLYLGDCLDVLPTLGKVDAVVTDPPYGINRDGKPPSTSRHGGHKGYGFLGWDSERPSPDAICKLVAAASECIIWGGNYFADCLPPSRCWLFWDKGQKLDQADGELAYTNLDKPTRSLTVNRVAIMSDGAVHPTQKPVAVMEWSLSFVSGGTILDPYMGSGTTGVACIRLDRRFIGIEKEPRYFEIAKKRIIAELNRTPLFDAPRPVQKSLLSEE